MSKENIIIGFVSPECPRDIKSWSGILHNMWVALSEEFEVVEIVHIKPLWQKIFLKLIAGMFRVFGKQFSQENNMFSSRLFAKRNQEKLKQPDVIVAPVASTEIACMDTKLSPPPASHLYFRHFLRSNKKLLSRFAKSG